MNKRPLSITIVGWVFIVVGSLGLASGLISVARIASVSGTSAVTRHQLLDASYVSLSGLIAAVGGAALLHGFRWARWIVVAWMAAHVVLSLFHSIFEVAIHTVLLVVLIYVLFRPQGSMSSTSQT
jgi:hypothetical protein